ncbi:MAG: hypothetical protein BGO63_12190 [Candidatus Accumulibacter sp. 66-26]|nr:porin [Accumulibacter sp.]OJW51744.1 MAG: hypothetical protein BGO63_12190 [Candidatus Accumulibacter sp. 66-26]
MQKKFIALAVAGLVSGAAFAQSNVTIYGVADVTFDNVKADNQAAGNVNAFERSNRVSANSSFIGFKGTEALGNGLNAVFQFEAAVANDNGGALSFNRDTFVGLSSNSWGTVVAGTLTGPTRALGASMDVFAGATGIGANSGLIGKLGNGLTGVTTDANGAPVAPGVGATPALGRSTTQTSIFDTRWKNAIAYVSPSFGGVTATAAYVANENHSATINTSGYDLGLNYANGPVKAGITYNAVTLKNQATNALTPLLGLGNDVKTNDLRIGGMYDFGVATVRAMYDRVKLESSLGDIKQNVWGLGATFNVSSAGKIVGQYYKAQDVKGTVALGAGADTGAALWAIGYEHSLSKRTILKATYANLNNATNANYDFGINATGGAVNNSTVSGFQFGMRHSF